MARPSHSDHVLQQLNNQREWGFLCDCLIAIGDIYFRAHKAVLAACSSYFRMMFIRDQQGAARLDLSNMRISAECFDLILQLMYLGRIVVGSYEFEQLKASMSSLQMYYIPESLDDLRDLRSSAPSPSSSSPSATAGNMMFGVRMYEQQRPEAENTPKVVAAAGRPVGRVAPEDGVSTAPMTVLGGADGGLEQPCDLRKRSGGRSSALKERPRFGRTFTCDDCGFVFSCEKLLIEHILTCTNRKALPPPQAGHAHSDSSASDPERAVKGDDDWPGHKADSDDEQAATVMSVKMEPEEGMFFEVEAGLVSDHGTPRDRKRASEMAEPGVSGLESSGDPADHTPGSSESGTPAKLRKVKDEWPDGGGDAPCEVCGAALTDEDRSAHYLSDHVTHICACGRCGQVLIKGRQLQEHAERCGEVLGDEALGGEAHGGDSDSHGEDEEPQGGEELADLACPHCGLLFQSEGVALEHALACHDHELFRPPLLDDGGGGGEPDHRRKHFCSICGKGFYQRCHLREHYTVHTKEKQFTCSTCGKQFLRERQLRLHTDMHKGMARYVCPVCEQGTFLKHDHVRHMISHLAAGETICQVCFQIFPGGEQLEQHMDVHLYICGVCGEKFRLRKDMRSHYNSKHTKRL